MIVFINHFSTCGCEQLHSEEKETTEGVVAHAIIVDQPACLERHVYIVSHLEGDDHGVAPHVITIRA